MNNNKKWSSNKSNPEKCTKHQQLLDWFTYTEVITAFKPSQQTHKSKLKQRLKDRNG